jgi:hypothetical protein
VSTRLAALACAAVGLAVFAAPANAATTRADWVAQVDPICQNGEAQEQSLIQPLIQATKRAEKHPKLRRKLNRRLERAYRSYFFAYGNIERAVNAQIATIPPAPDDVSLVQVWLRARGELVDLETGLLAHNGKKGAQKFFSSIFELLGRQFEVADLVRDFGFQYCNQGQISIVVGAVGDVFP